MAKGDRQKFNQQESQAFGQGQQAASYGFNKARNLIGQTQADYSSMYNNPGYSAGEKQAMANASALGTAGAYGDAQTQLANRVAATGNSAGFGAGLEELGREKARDTALRDAQLQQQFANQRIQGQQFAVRGLESLLPSVTDLLRAGFAQQSSALGDQARVATTPGLWRQAFSNILGRVTGPVGGGFSLGRG
jgi:hypothetical protein